MITLSLVKSRVLVLVKNR